MNTARIVRAVQRLNQVLGRIERRSAQSLGVSVSQMRLLLRLLEHHRNIEKNNAGVEVLDGPTLKEKGKVQGMRVSDLAHDEELAVSTMTRNLVGLERHGWVLRRKDPHDRRSIKVDLTDSGERLAGDLYRVQDMTLSAAMCGFHSSDRLERALACEKVAQALSKVLERPL